MEFDKGVYGAMTMMPRCGLLVLALFLVSLSGGVRRDIQDDYTQKYLNKTLFLKLPINGARQVLMVRPGGVTPVEGPARTETTFLVGEQIRVTQVKFSGQEIRFVISSIDLARQNELTFRFIHELGDDFPERDLFEDALDKTFTEGLSNREIADARKEFLRREFERALSQMASVSSSSREFVLESIADDIPSVRESRQRANQASTQAENYRNRLEGESQARQQAEAALERLRREGADNEEAIDSLKQDRERLSDENQRLQREVSRLRSSSEDYKKQIAQLASNLDVSSSAKSDLSRSLTELNLTVEGLKKRVDTSELELENKTRENERLSGELSRVKTERDRMDRNLRSLTSDKNSLSSRYVEANEAKERLETADQLGEALRLDVQGGESESLRADLMLGSHKIGGIEVEKPGVPGRDYLLRVALDSPDTVEFTDEERRLYSSLGEKVRIEAGWRSSSPDLSVSLKDGESERSLSPRESAEWSWEFQGPLSRPETATLTLHLFNQGGLKIPLAEKDFTVRPSGLLSSAGGFSPLWLGLGVVLGIAAMIPVLFLRGQPGRRDSGRGGKGRPSKAAVDSEAYPAAKKF